MSYIFRSVGMSTSPWFSVEIVRFSGRHSLLSSSWGPNIFRASSLWHWCLSRIFWFRSIQNNFFLIILDRIWALCGTPRSSWLNTYGVNCQMAICMPIFLALISFCNNVNLADFTRVNFLIWIKSDMFTLRFRLCNPLFILFDGRFLRGISRDITLRCLQFLGRGIPLRLAKWSILLERNTRKLVFWRLSSLIRYISILLRDLISFDRRRFLILDLLIVIKHILLLTEECNRLSICSWLLDLW